MIDLHLELPIAPCAKGRPRATAAGGRARMFTPSKTRHWEAAAAELAAPLMPDDIIDEPIRVAILAVVQRPQALLRKKDPDGLMWCSKKPDADNYAKAVLDSFAPFWRDDSLVVDVAALKVYAERDGRPRVLVRIRSTTQHPEGRVAALFGYEVSQ